MSGACFAGWTRRHLGLTAGGMLGALARAAGFGDETAVAKRRRRHVKPKRCHRLHQKCHVGRSRVRCCAGLQCDKTVTSNGLARRCCRQILESCADQADCCYPASCDAVSGQEDRQCCGEAQRTCASDAECCRELRCGQATGLAGTRCCAEVGATCHANGDCCAFALCNAVTLTCERVS